MKIARHAAAVALLCVAVSTAGRRLSAADQWIEVKSANFVVTSNSGQGAARKLAWQLEQVRSAIATVYPWAKVDLNRPLSVFAVKDENAMKALAPSYWERKGGLRPVSVWVSGAHQNYLAIRTDVSAEDTSDINPYVTSYFSYVSLVLGQSFERDMPLWFSRGLAGVLSNTLVRESKLLLGMPIPWHLERIRENARLKLPALLAVDRKSPDFLDGERLQTFDAESWAFVHFLMFGEAGARWPKLDQFIRLVESGAEPQVAFREALGRPEDLEAPFGAYISRSIFSARQLNVDASVKREGFAVRSLALPESASRRALFHAAMDRPLEARAAIAEARKGDASAPDSFAAEAILLDREGKIDEARAAYERATGAGSAIGYAYYRLASLLWRPDPDPATLKRVEALLAEAIARNTRDAWAYAWIGEVRAILGTGEPLGMVLRAISLDPSEPQHRLRAANVLWRQRKYDEALKHAQSALELASDEETRRRAKEAIDGITRAKGR